MSLHSDARFGRLSMSLPEIPDRLTPLRSPILDARTALRTSLSPDLLSDRERYSRSRDIARNPFRGHSEPRSKTKRITRNSNGPLTPHYTPSFIHHDVDELASSPARSLSIRYISLGGVWAVGGRVAAIPSQLQGVDAGTGEVLASGTHAPMITASFIDKEAKDMDQINHESRVALALNIDRTRRILPISPPTSPISEHARSGWHDGFDWNNEVTHTRDSLSKKNPSRSSSRSKPEKAVPSMAFRVLDAPRLKDDFYCSVLAYSQTCRTLAVALTHRVYLWTEQHGVRYPPLPPTRVANYVSALAFSSEAGSKAILAVARNSGHVILWSLFEQKSRFEAPHP